MKFTELNLIKKKTLRGLHEVLHDTVRGGMFVGCLIYEKCAKSGEFLFRSQVF